MPDVGLLVDLRGCPAFWDQSKFESKLEEFLKENNCSNEEFVAECKQFQATSADGFGIVNVILATLEFDVFMQMMTDAKSRF